MKKLERMVDLELWFWILGLVWLWFANPETADHRGLWWPEWIWGIKSPGYGLGHAIAYLLEGRLLDSWEAHWLGIPALVLIVYRIWRLMELHWKKKGGVIDGSKYITNNA